MYNRLFLTILFGSTLCLAEASAASTPTLQRPDISLAAAKLVLVAAMDACHANGRTLTAAVVDRSGNLVMLQRDDDIGPHNIVAAQRKAFTALSTRTATAQLADNARLRPQTHNLNTIGELLLLGGGVPIQIGDAVIGAIGVAGAGAPEIDESCARAGISSVFPSTTN